MSNVALEDAKDKSEDLTGKIPESWHCVDCGVNTAPGMFNRVDFERAIAAAKAAGTWPEQGIKQTFDSESEVYCVRDAVWKASGIEDFGGCLCIGCLEKRLGRKLRPKDFLRGHSFNLPNVPGTPRLLNRRGKPKGERVTAIFR